MFDLPAHVSLPLVLPLLSLLMTLLALVRYASRPPLPTKHTGDCEDLVPLSLSLSGLALDAAAYHASSNSNSALAAGSGTGTRPRGFFHRLASMSLSVAAIAGLAQSLSATATANTAPSQTRIGSLAMREGYAHELVRLAGWPADKKPHTVRSGGCSALRYCVTS